jgi:hypothetical protein
MTLLSNELSCADDESAAAKARQSRALLAVGGQFGYIHVFDISCANDSDDAGSADHKSTENITSSSAESTEAAMASTKSAVVTSAESRLIASLPVHTLSPVIALPPLATAASISSGTTTAAQLKITGPSAALPRKSRAVLYFSSALSL